MAAFVFCKLHRKTPVPESLFSCNFIKKETLAKVFSCEFYEITKNTFFYRTPLVAASGCISTFVLENIILYLVLIQLLLLGIRLIVNLELVLQIFITLCIFLSIYYGKKRYNTIVKFIVLSFNLSIL